MTSKPETTTPGNTPKRSTAMSFHSGRTILAIALVVVGMAAYLFIDQAGWWFFAVGVALLVGLALWLLNSLLKWNLPQGITRLNFTAKNRANRELPPSTTPVGYNPPPTIETGAPGQFPQLHLTESALETLRHNFCQQAQADFDGLAVYHKVDILAVTATLAELFGFAPTELTGMTLLDLVTPESRSTVLRNTVIKYERPYGLSSLIFKFFTSTTSCPFFLMLTHRI